MSESTKVSTTSASHDASGAKPVPFGMKVDEITMDQGIEDLLRMDPSTAQFAQPVPGDVQQPVRDNQPPARPDQAAQQPPPPAADDDSDLQIYEELLAAEAAQSQQQTQQPPVQPPAQPEAPTYLFEHEGRGVTAEEAQQGYMMKQDYSRKTQELARDRDALQSRLGEVQARRDEYVSRLEALKTEAQARLNRIDPDELEKLRGVDDLAYLKIKEEQRAEQDRLAAIEAQQRQAQEEAQREAAEQQKSWLAEQRELLPQLIPEWRDEAVAAAEKEGIKKYLVENGATPEEVGLVANARHVKVFRDAMIGEKVRKARLKRKAREAPPPANMGGGARMPQTGQESRASRERQAMEALDRSRPGSPDRLDRAVDLLQIREGTMR